jgi:hypothetical protein
MPTAEEVVCHEGGGCGNHDAAAYPQCVRSAPHGLAHHLWVARDAHDARLPHVKLRLVYRRNLQCAHTCTAHGPHANCHKRLLSQQLRTSAGLQGDMPHMASSAACNTFRRTPSSASPPHPPKAHMRGSLPYAHIPPCLKDVERGGVQEVEAEEVEDPGGLVHARHTAHVPQRSPIVAVVDEEHNGYHG